jgi:predicted nucleic acid-binding protein
VIKPRIYLDTSVFGGCFDDEFAKESLRLIEEIKAGKFVLVLSESVYVELESAPGNVREIPSTIPGEYIETIALSAEAERLRDAYVNAGVVGAASAKDAEHIAIATAAHVNMIISWNSKHIVHFEKISGYHAVNRSLGYGEPAIYSPKAVVSYEN